MSGPVPASTGPDPASTGPDPASTGPDPASTGPDPASTGPDPTSTGPAGITAGAEALAAELLVEGMARRSGAEARQGRRLARLMAAPAGRELLLALTDEVLRVRSPARAARLLGGIASGAGASGLGPLDRLALRAGGAAGRVLPRVVVPLVRARVRAEMAGVILPAGPRRLARHVARRRAQGIRLNVNVLGEAVLGEDEAEARLDRVLKVLAEPSVDYVSVKISSVASQLDVLAFDDEVHRVAERLRRLYRAAAGHRPARFVNLDMEEYRDLELTVAVFERVLDEAEFTGLPAGIVLQAYLPDSAAALEELAAWARRRRDRGGAWVKVRIVKGANLAMEAVEAELHGWPQAPFLTKDRTDANYKRLLSTALDPANAGALRVGVATHNLFELGWAATETARLGAGDRVEFEMLEGMSPAVAEVAAERLGGLLLYAPVVDRQDLEAAIAYLVRRLDENTGKDNFIAHQWAMSPSSPEWAEQAGRLRRSVGAARGPAPGPRRDQDRSVPGPVPGADPAGPFQNEPDTDFSRRVNREWAAGWVRDLAGGLPEYRPVVAGAAVAGPALAEGVDPSRDGAACYRWAPAAHETVDRAMEVAAGSDWPAASAATRRAVLLGAATGLAGARGRLLATMVHDTGKTLREGDPEVSEAVDFAAWYARHLPDPAAGFRPYGPVVVASPWNFPLSIPAGGVLAALAAGCPVILKPAPEAVAVAGELARALWEAGVPADALQFVPCADDDAGRRLVTHPGVGAVVMTGSWDTARTFLGWRPDMRLHAETSGKNAVVVTATADPDQAIADILTSAFGHAGQKCSAASLAILEAPVHDDGRFLRRLADAVRSLKPGPAAAPSTRMGPLIRPPEGPLAEALGRPGPGERWLVEPRRLDRSGYRWSPGVKTGVEPGSPFHLTECFGPVLGVMRAADLDEALAWQNAPQYGLTAGLQALDPGEIEHWRDRVEAGNLYVNRTTTGAIVGRQPFGGWKRSVVGPGAKAGGPNYVDALGSWPVAAGAPAPGAHARAWRSMSHPVDRSGLAAESNAFRYRPLRLVALWSAGDADQEAHATAAAAACGVEVRHVSSPAEAEGADKLRLLGPHRPSALAAAVGTGMWVDTRAAAADPGREVLCWVREQAVSESRHRHGNVTGRRPGLVA